MPVIKMPDGHEEYFPDVTQVVGLNAADYLVPQVQELYGGKIPYANEQALLALRQEALRPSTEESPWLRMARERSRAQIETQRDRELAAAQRGALSQAAQQRAQLAMRGGITSGASERLGREALQEAFRAKQDLRSRAGAAISDQELALAQQAEQNRLALLQAQPGQELAMSAPKINIEMAKKEAAARALQAGAQERLQRESIRFGGMIAPHQEALKSYAAAQQAGAYRQANTGKK